MIIAIDTETRGLNTNNYITGCLIRENYEQSPEIYRNKQELWNRILELGYKEGNRKKKLTIYSHWATYDFYSYIDRTHKGLKIYCEEPLIADLRLENGGTITFLDTHSLVRMSLAKAARLIGMEKKEMPELLMEENTPKEIIEKNLPEIEKYMIQDTLIAMKLYQRVKEEANTHMKNKRLYTIYQIAISYVVNEMKKMKNNDHVFYNKKYGKFWLTSNTEDIHHAYKGGRVEAWKTGKNMQNIAYIDINSLYPYAATKIQFPDLRTERKIIEPLRFKKKEEILKSIGISKCLVTNTEDDIGFLAVHKRQGNIFPVAGATMLGIWTHDELQYAESIGYKIHNIEWSILYDKGENLLKPIMEKLYTLRKVESDPFKDYLYKQYMNGSIGKFAQRAQGDTILVDSVDNAWKHLNEGYEIILAEDDSYIYKRKNAQTKPKRHYAPILSALITAKARIIMHEHYSKIPKEDLYYTDTDSIVMHKRHLHKFEISDKLGYFSLETADGEATIYGRKHYRVDNVIKMSGIRTKNLVKEDFDLGIMKGTKMTTMSTAHSIDNVGTFKEKIADLDAIKKRHEEVQRVQFGEKLAIDANIKDITYFLDTIKDILQSHKV